MSRRILAAMVVAMTVLGAARTAHAEDADDREHEHEHEKRPAVSGKIDVGVTYRQIFQLPVVGPEGGVGVGIVPASQHRPELFFWARYAYGTTPDHLGVHAARLASRVEGSIGRVRPSFGLDLIWLGLTRATERGLVQHWGYGAGGALTVDVITNGDRQALYVGPSATVDLIPHFFVPRTVSWSGSLTAGYRF